MSLFTAGIGSSLRNITLAELEDKVRKIRALGAPDDAQIIKVAPGSIYLAECIWVDHEETDRG